MMDQINTRQRKLLSAQARKSGFTLVEMLVVMAVIGLMSFVVISTFDSGPVRDLENTMRKMDGVFSMARNLAVSENASVQILVHADGSDDEKEDTLRKIVVLYDDAGTWRFYDETMTGEGVFFDPVLSQVSNNVTNLTIEDSGAVSAGSVRWYFYGFNANGTFSDPNARLVFSIGLADRSQSDDPEVSYFRDENNAVHVDGFMVPRAGRPMHFMDRTEITASAGFDGR